MKALKITPYLCIPHVSAFASTIHMVGSLVQLKVNTQFFSSQCSLTRSGHIFPMVNPRNFEEDPVKEIEYINKYIPLALLTQGQSTHCRTGLWHGKCRGMMLRVCLEQVVAVHIKAAPSLTYKGAWHSPAVKQDITNLCLWY